MVTGKICPELFFKPMYKSRVIFLFLGYKRSTLIYTGKYDISML